MEYIISYSVFTTSNEQVVPALNANGGRGELNGNMELVGEPVNHGYYTSYTYKLTIPGTYTQKLAFLGFSLPFYAEGYLFDFECHPVEDPSVSGWENGDFSQGLDGWILGWSATWFTDYGRGLTYWSDGTQFVQVLPRHLKFVEDLANDMTRDDGEWWTPADVAEEEEVENGVANVSGTFVDENGKPVPNVKLVLKSDNNSYTTKTDSKGRFAFSNIVAQYYDLYFVNAKGEEISTDISIVLSDGDNATIKITTDTSNLAKKSGFSGTVYTPQLKTVPNLKIYLRGFGETVTDADGKFAFTDVPVGEYDLYTVLDDGSEYIFRTVSIKENVELAVKLKFAPGGDVVITDDGDIQDGNWFMDNLPLIIAIVSAIGIIVAVAIIVFIVLKKKKSAKV